VARFPRNRNKKVTRKAPDRMAHHRKPRSLNKLHVSQTHDDDFEEEEYDELTLPVWMFLLTLFLGFILLFPCVTITKMVVGQFTSNDLVWQLRGNTLASFFAIGVITTVALLFLRPIRQLLLPLYVLGHEATHAIFVYIFYGSVSKFNARADGGYIIANRANILVSLSPYILPFWTLILVTIYAICSVFFNLSSITPYFFFLFGASWIFNLFWTIWMIPLGQSDLSSNGTFFSLTLIYLTNAYILSILLEFTKISPSLSEWLFNLLNIHSDLFHSLTSLLPF